jgi:hypothetical protein
MPCYSRITATQVLDADVLAEALAKLGIEVYSKSQNQVQTAIGTYSRYTNGSAFSFEGQDVAAMKKVNTEYAALKAKAYMKRAGFSITGEDISEDGRRVIRGTNRRG